MTDFIIIGGGDHAKVIIEVLRAMNMKIIGAVDANKDQTHVLDVPILGDDAILPSLRHQGVANVAMGIGDNRLRERLGKRAHELGFSAPPLIHPSALISPSARIGRGVVVMARAVIGVQAILRDMSLVNTGAILDHDNDLGGSAHVAPGCAIAGNVHIGDRTLIGVGSAIRPGVRIGSDSIIGAGSAVVSNIGDKQIVGGAPARPIKTGAQ